MSKLKKASLIGGTIIILAAVAITALELTNTTHIFHAKPTTKVATNSHKATPKITTPQPASQTTSSSNQKSDPGVPPSNSPKYPTAPSGDKNLMAPTGTFANEYNVTMGEQLGSNCVTNSGIYCQLTFTKDGSTKTLAKQLTDAGGNTSWVWTPKSIGLSPGTWHIKAVASYNGQTKTTNNDPLTLEVKS